MNPGDTIRNFDFGNHLWIVVSEPVGPDIALVSLISHTTNCIDDACHLEPGDHPFVRHRSCLFYRKALLTPVQPLIQADEQNVLLRDVPLSATLLLQVQQGALSSRFTARTVKAAIRATLDKGS